MFRRTRKRREEAPVALLPARQCQTTDGWRSTLSETATRTGLAQSSPSALCRVNAIAEWTSSRACGPTGLRQYCLTLVLRLEVNSLGADATVALALAHDDHALSLLHLLAVASAKVCGTIRIDHRPGQHECHVRAGAA